MLRENSKSNAIELLINRGFSYEEKKKKGRKKLREKNPIDTAKIESHL